MIAIVVEDDKAFRRYLKTLLAKAGYEVLAFATFRSAVAYIPKIKDHSKVRRIISDYKISGDLLNGISFLGCLEEFFVNAPCLILSGRDDIRDQVEALGYKFIMKASSGWQLRLKEFVGIE